MDTCKSLDINIGTVMKNIEILKFIPGHLKTKKLPYLLRYVAQKCKARQMCDIAIMENGGTLRNWSNITQKV